MNSFQQYLEMAKKESNITISDVDRNNLKKLKDEDFFKSSYGFKKEPWEKEGKWEWSENEKVRWFNADYKEGDNANFQAEYWMPILNDDQRKEYGIHEQQLFNYQKPYKLIGVRDASRRGQAPGRNIASKTGSKVTWLYKLGEEKIQQLAGNKEKIQQLNYKTARITDAVLTFYGSPQDLLKLIS